MTNTAVGDAALEANTTGISNTAIGAFALQASNSTFNTAVGVGALMANQFSENTAVGHLALAANTLGGSNTAVGFQALTSESDGFFNAAFGDDAMEIHMHGDRNTAAVMQRLVSSPAAIRIPRSARKLVRLQQQVLAMSISVQTSQVLDGETDHTYIRNINTTSVSGGGTDTVTDQFVHRFAWSSQFLATSQGAHSINERRQRNVVSAKAGYLPL